MSSNGTPHVTVHDLAEALAPAAHIKGDNLLVSDEGKLRAAMDWLIRDAVFGPDPVKVLARRVIWEAGIALNAIPASINDFYMARGRNEYGNLTVPAMNLRGLAYDSAKAAFRAANARGVGALIFEIARSEMGYTDQRPTEYVAAIQAAALKEGFQGPVFVQGDHFQMSLKNYGKDPAKEYQAVKDLIDEALAAGFYNIDIDSSTLVDLSKATVPEQQELNSSIAAELSAYIREREPQGVTVSLGGEIGEVGGHNSNIQELRAYMDGYNAILQRLAPGAVGLSKISIQTGTAHGGVIMPDGSLASVKIDFDVLRELSDVGRAEYGMGGAVQHGASTLPPEAFAKFVEAGACEVHLATGFQTAILTHPAMPTDVKQAVRDYCFANLTGERGAKDSDEQFVYKTSKKVWGPMKRQFWDLPQDTMSEIMGSLEAQFGFLFEQLNVVNTKDLVAQFVKPVAIHKPQPEADAALVEIVDTATDLAD